MNGKSSRQSVGRSMNACFLKPREMNALFPDREDDAPRDRHPNAGDVHLYIALRSYRNSETCDAFPSISTLSRNLGVSRVSVMNRIENAERLGLIVCERRSGKATRYRFPFADEPTYTTPASQAGLTSQSGFTGQLSLSGPVKFHDPTSKGGLTLTSSNNVGNSAQRIDETYIEEQAQRLERAHGGRIDRAKLRDLIESSRLPLSRISRPIADVCERPRGSVHSPLHVLGLRIQDECVEHEQELAAIEYRKRPDCETCFGNGYVYDEVRDGADACPSCNGSGKEPTSEELPASTTNERSTTNV